MKHTKILGNTKKLDRDVELCRATSERIIDQATRLLVENQIPFTRDWIRIPFFQREKYRGASHICVIRTNRNRYGQARRAIDQLEAPFKQRLVLSNY